MTREEQLIKEAKIWEDAYCNKCDQYHMLEIHASSLREQLDQLKKENEWISVEDRLPDLKINIMVWGEQKNMNPQMGGAHLSITRRLDLQHTSLIKQADRYQDKNQFMNMSYVTH